MIMTATSAAIGMIATTSPNPTTRMSRKTPARKVEIPGTGPGGLHVDHGLADHGAAPHAAEAAGDDVGGTLAPRFSGLLRVGVGDVVDQLRGQERLQQPDQGHRQRVRGDDPQGVEVQGDVRHEQRGQGVGECALVADVGNGEGSQDGEPGQGHDRYQWRGDELGDARQADHHCDAIAIIG